MKKQNSALLFHMFLSIACIVTAAAAMLCNLGFMGIFWVLTALPLFHALLFLVVNLNVAVRPEMPHRKLLTALFYITYLTVYCFYPDVDEVTAFFFFGLIQNPSLLPIARITARVSLLINLILAVILIVKAIRYKKSLPAAD